LSKEGKKPFYKKWWFWVIIIIVVIGAAAGAGGGSDDKQTADNSTKEKVKTTTAQPKEETKKEEPKKETEKTHKIGDTVKVGDMVYRVNKISTADQVGPSVLPTKANGKFLIVDLTLKNNGDKAVTVDSSFFKLKRGDKTYEADSEASMSANQDEDGNITNSFFLQELNPDSEMSGKVVFDVAPDVASAKDLQLQVQTGLFGTQTDVISLHK